RGLKHNAAYLQSTVKRGFRGGRSAALTRKVVQTSMRFSRSLRLEDLLQHLPIRVRQLDAQEMGDGGGDVDVVDQVELCAGFDAGAGGDEGGVHVVGTRVVAVCTLVTPGVDDR